MSHWFRYVLIIPPNCAQLCALCECKCTWGKRLEDDRLAYFRLPTQTGEAGGKSDKTLSQLLPNGIKKSSAHQIGIAILTYMKARPSQFYTIIHYVERPGVGRDVL